MTYPTQKIESSLRASHAELDHAVLRHQDEAALAAFVRVAGAWLMAIGAHMPRCQVMGGARRPKSPEEPWTIIFNIDGVDQEGHERGRRIQVKHVNPLVACFRLHHTLVLKRTLWSRFFGYWLLPLFPTFFLRSWLRDLGNVYAASTREFLAKAPQDHVGQSEIRG